MKLRKRNESTYEVKSRASLEPFNLALVEGVRELDLLFRSVAVLDTKRQVLAGRKRLKTKDIHTVVGADLLVVLRVRERQREHALLLQVRLVDAREGPDDDREATEEARLERSVLARGALAVVRVADDDPLDALLPVLGRDLRDTAPRACELVADLVRLAVLGVDGADETVLRNVLEMTTVLEPGAASGDVVSCYRETKKR